MKAFIRFILAILVATVAVGCSTSTHHDRNGVDFGTWRHTSKNGTTYGSVRTDQFILINNEDLLMEVSRNGVVLREDIQPGETYTLSFGSAAAIPGETIAISVRLYTPTPAGYKKIKYSASEIFNLRSRGLRKVVWTFEKGYGRLQDRSGYAPYGYVGSYY